MGRDSQAFVDSAPLANVKKAEELAAHNGTPEDWAAYVAATEVFTARRTLLRQSIAACERNMALSATARLSEIEKLKTSHVRRAAERWRQLAGEQDKALEAGLATQVGVIYEAEARSFYNPEMSHFEDRDIGKDYPDLLALVRNSNLDQGTKGFIDVNAQLLRYEEAGQLADILRGTDKERGLDYAYILRRSLEERAATAAQKRDQLARQREKEQSKKMADYGLEVLVVFIILIVVWIWSDRARAKYRAFRTGAKRSPFWFGNAEWVLWEPGETVVLLQHKRLVPMMDSVGGYLTISAWKGQEFKGRISYKTRFSTWTSDPILTSDGLAVNLALGIWWRIANAGIYVSAISSDYHEGSEHHSEDLSEAAEIWIKKLAAGTLREEVNQLPAEKLISPYVQKYLQVQRGPEEELLPQDALPNFSQQLGTAQSKLNEKTLRYGIEIERLEVQELVLPRVYQEKLESVRVAFLQPIEARALTDAQVIALQGLASVIGKDKVGLIEVLKHVDLSRATVNPFTSVVPVLQPVFDTLQRQSERALPETSPHDRPLPEGSGDSKQK